MSKKAADVTSEDGDAGAPKRSRKRNKKPKDMPKRPLSAYNLFFADERERILSAQRQGVEQPDFIFPSEEEAERQKQVGKKRAPILFQALARCVGKRWGGLDAEAKKKYEVQAEEEMKKYRVRMEEYQQNIVMNTMAQSAKQKRKRIRMLPVKIPWIIRVEAAPQREPQQGSRPNWVLLRLLPQPQVCSLQHPLQMELKSGESLVLHQRRRPACPCHQALPASRK